MPSVSLNVKLLRYTPDPERVVAMAARLCYSAADLNDLADKASEGDPTPFLKRLMAMGHLSPIEHATFTFGVEGISRAASHQLVRHRLASYSQQSQRYVAAGGEGREFGFIIPPSVKAAGRERWFAERVAQIQEWYDELREALGGEGEAANEDARFLLPNATETKLIVTMNARELLHFFAVRCCNRAQWEIRAMAVEMLRLCRQVAPTLFAEAGPGCLRGPCPEGKMTCGQIVEVRREFAALGVRSSQTNE